jgi:hypothetical protein
LLPNPLCSTFPNGETKNAKEISEDWFFVKRNIRVPIKPGRKGVRLNKYEHLKQEPAWKPFLECDCEIVGENVDEDRACMEGKILNLSRGVGGDKSFFVHVPNTTGSYKVIAHICFE